MNPNITNLNSTQIYQHPCKSLRGLSWGSQAHPNLQAKLIMEYATSHQRLSPVIALTALTLITIPDIALSMCTDASPCEPLNNNLSFIEIILLFIGFYAVAIAGAVIMRLFPNAAAAALVIGMILFTVLLYYAAYLLFSSGDMVLALICFAWAGYITITSFTD